MSRDALPTTDGAIGSTQWRPGTPVASVTTVNDDAADFTTLVGSLDLEVNGFHMHQR